MGVLVDTNIWAYRLDRREVHKGQFMKTWLRQLAQDHEIVISTQVQIEYALRDGAQVESGSVIG